MANNRKSCCLVLKVLMLFPLIRCGGRWGAGVKPRWLRLYTATTSTCRTCRPNRPTCRPLSAAMHRHGCHARCIGLVAVDAVATWYLGIPISEWNFVVSSLSERKWIGIHFVCSKKQWLTFGSTKKIRTINMWLLREENAVSSTITLFLCTYIQCYEYIFVSVCAYLSALPPVCSVK